MPDGFILVLFLVFARTSREESWEDDKLTASTHLVDRINHASSRALRVSSALRTDLGSSKLLVTLSPSISTRILPYTPCVYSHLAPCTYSACNRHSSAAVTPLRNQELPANENALFKRWANHQLRVIKVINIPICNISHAHVSHTQDEPQGARA